MTVEAKPRPQRSTPAKSGIIDSDIHPLLSSPDALAPYLSTTWREHFETWGYNLRHPFVIDIAYPRSQPFLARRDAFPPDGGPPGSNLAFMREQHLDPLGIEMGVLSTLFPVCNGQKNLDFSAALSTAINDWQIEEWTRPEPRLKASLIIPHEDPVAAVAEIERRAPSGEFVQVVLAPRSLEPLGRRRYWPIYETAAHYGLPLGLHTGGWGGHAPTGSGYPSYYFEEQQSNSQTMQSMVVSFIAEGVFERFPELKVILIEASVSWIPALGWRMDKHWPRFESELPHLKKPPSHYLRKHFWTTTQPMDEPEQRQDLLHMYKWIGLDRILFASDYPHWDSDDPNIFNTVFTTSERQKVFRENALQVYGLS